MTQNIIVPASLEAVIQKFDAATSPFSDYVVSSDLSSARQALQNPTTEENLGAWAEVLAFAFSEQREGSVWGTFFGPRATMQDKDGNTFYSPGIDDTPPEVVAHWAARARNLKHPMLKARYADLAWDMAVAIGKSKRNPDDARLAIESYLAAIPVTDVHEQVRSGIRALDLAQMIGDQPRSAAAKDALINLFRASMKKPPGMWWVPFDRLIDDKRTGVTEAEHNELIVGVEGLVTSHANVKESFDPHRCGDSVQRLLPIYRRQQKFDDIKRLHEVVARVFEEAASRADAMLAAAFLQTALENFEAAQLKDEAKRIRILMQKAINDSQEQMQPICHEITIKKDDIESFVDKVVVDKLGDSLANIAFAFVLKREALGQQVKDLEENAPLYAMINQQIMADDRVAATIGSVKDDPFGRLFEQAKMSLAFANIWMVHSFQRLVEKHKIDVEHLASWANRHKLFDDMGLLIHGLHAWFQGDHVKAVHLLVPQVERGLRKIAGEIGLPVTKTHPNVKGTSVAINMGDILFQPQIADALGENLTFHMQALYSDPRGLNLRNELAHGLMDASDFQEHTSNLVVHSLLMLGLWKELGDHDRRSKA